MLIPELYTLYKQHPTVTTDSRVCPPGSIFFALKGESFDGNAFAEKALQSGCAYAIIDDSTYYVDIPVSDTVTPSGAVTDDASVCVDNRMILVDDVLSTLQQLACLHRKTLGIKVIGITGTNGKTTTKELTAAVLSKKYDTLFTQGNLNNHIGVPLTLLKLTKENEIAIIEMGANHPGEIRDLAIIAQPDFGLITNIGYAHLEGFGSFEGVVRTKGELYEYLREAGGKIFINSNNELLTKIAGDLEQISYSICTEAYRAGSDTIDNYPKANDKKPLISGKVLNLHPYLSFKWQQDESGMQYPVETHLVGDYNLLNILAAISIGVYFNVSPEQINDAIANYEPSNNRSQLFKTANNTLILDAYNANPSSMRAALANFASLPEIYSEKSLEAQSEKSLDTSPNSFPKKQPQTALKPLPKAVILGDMLELGEKSPELHDDIVRLAESSGIEKIILCGEQFSAVGKGHLCFPSVEVLCEFLKYNPLQGYHLLIKGSHGIHLENIIKYL